LNLPDSDLKKGRKKVAGMYKSTHTKYAKRIPWLSKWQNDPDQKLFHLGSSDEASVTIDDRGNTYDKDGKKHDKKKKK